MTRLRSLVDGRFGATSQTRLSAAARVVPTGGLHPPRRDTEFAQSIVRLQRSVGNQAVVALLASSPASSALGSVVRRLPEAEAGQRDALALAIGKVKASWISSHPSEQVGLWVKKPKDELDAFLRMPLADFKAAYPARSVAPVPVVVEGAPKPASIAGGGGNPGATVTSPSTPPKSVPKPTPAPAPLTPKPTPASAPLTPTPLTPTPLTPPPTIVTPLVASPSPPAPDEATQFQTRLAAVNAGAAKVAVDDAAKLRTIGDVGRAVISSHFVWPTTEYRFIYAKAPGLATMTVDLAAFVAQVKRHAENPALLLAQKLAMVSWAVTQLARLQSIVDKTSSAATDRANELLAATATHYTSPFVKATVLPFLEADIKRRIVAVGARRSDYRSSYDKGERNTFGASYDLINSPYVLHIHAAGKGTSISALSIKHPPDPPGTVVFSERAIPVDTRSELLSGLNRAPENPRTIALDREAGTRAPGRSGI